MESDALAKLAELEAEAAARAKKTVTAEYMWYFRRQARNAAARARAQGNQTPEQRAEALGVAEAKRARKAGSP